MQGTVVGRVVSKGVLPTRKGLRIFQAVLKDDTGMIEVAWPGQPYLDRSITKGDMLLVSGTVRFFHGRQLQPREYINLGDDEEGTAQGRVLSVYPATEGRSRLAFEELLFVQLLQQRAKSLARVGRIGIKFENRRNLTTKLREALPFTLTSAQVRVLREIFADMCSDRSMQRLLQGDVGS